MTKDSCSFFVPHHFWLGAGKLFQSIRVVLEHHAGLGADLLHVAAACGLLNGHLRGHVRIVEMHGIAMMSGAPEKCLGCRARDGTAGADVSIGWRTLVVGARGYMLLILPLCGEKHKKIRM